MTQQTTSSTTSSIAPEDSRSVAVAILGATPKEARPAAIIGTTKRRCLYVFTLDLYRHDLVYGCYVMYGCDEYCEI
jgi:hypothetical protein